MRQHNIRHIVIEDSLQWVPSRTITRTCNVLHVDLHAIQLPLLEPDYIPMLDFNWHSHVSIAQFIPMAAVPSHSAVNEKGQEVGKGTSAATAVDRTSCQVHALASVSKATPS